VKDSSESRTIFGGIVPHAGYTYSAACSAHTLQKICADSVPDTFIILGNVHTGYREISIMREGEWETPFGKQTIDHHLAELIIAHCSEIVADDSAFLGYPHEREHNIEVQVPFIQYISKKAGKPIQFVPIAVGAMKFEKLSAFGKQLGKMLQSVQGKKNIAVLASSDMTHHEPKNRSQPADDIKWQYEKDGAVMNAFEKGDIASVYKNAQATTVCGPQTITSLMITGKEMGFEKTEKLKYYTSYDKMGGSGPCDYSVGYFSGVICK
jgi:AmmeMemoRadiSam system protein B